MLPRKVELGKYLASLLGETTTHSTRSPELLPSRKNSLLQVVGRQWGTQQSPSCPHRAPILVSVGLLLPGPFHQFLIFHM